MWNNNGGTDGASYVTTYLPAYNWSALYLFADAPTTSQGGTLVIERIA